MTRNDPQNRVSIAIAAVETALALAAATWSGVLAAAGTPSLGLTILAVGGGLGAGIAWLLCD